MSNMSYCRFQNTVLDLTDCYHALMEAQDGCDEEGRKAEPLSVEEASAAAQLIATCADIIKVVLNATSANPVVPESEQEYFAHDDFLNAIINNSEAIVAELNKKEA